MEPAAYRFLILLLLSVANLLALSRVLLLLGRNTGDGS